MALFPAWVVPEASCREVGATQVGCRGLLRTGPDAGAFHSSSGLSPVPVSTFFGWGALLAGTLQAGAAFGWGALLAGAVFGREALSAGAAFGWGARAATGGASPTFLHRRSF